MHAEPRPAISFKNLCNNVIGDYIESVLRTPCIQHHASPQLYSRVVQKSTLPKHTPRSYNRSGHEPS